MKEKNNTNKEVKLKQKQKRGKRQLQRSATGTTELECNRWPKPQIHACNTKTASFHSAIQRAQHSQRVSKRRNTIGSTKTV